MFAVEDAPIETLHIYIEREQPPRPSLLPMVLSVVAFASLIAIGVLSPAQQPVTRTVIRVPAVPLGVRTFTAEAPIIPTGIKTYPATTAHGILTITNGSIIAQVIPAHFMISNVATDAAVYVPPGNATAYGYATVSAHALISGTGGNFARLAINQVIGSSIYIRNLSAFSGGKDAYTVKIITAQDKHAALLRAQSILFDKIRVLHYPCAENHFRNVTNMVVTWRCTFVSYHIPAFYHVTAVRLSGNDLIVAVWFVVRPAHIWVK